MKREQALAEWRNLKDKFSKKIEIMNSNISGLAAREYENNYQNWLQKKFSTNFYNDDFFVVTSLNKNVTPSVIWHLENDNFLNNCLVYNGRSGVMLPACIGKAYGERGRR